MGCSRPLRPNAAAPERPPPMDDDEKEFIMFNFDFYLWCFVYRVFEINFGEGKLCNLCEGLC